MAGTIDSAIERKRDQEVDLKAKQEQRRRDAEDEGISHRTVANDGRPRPKKRVQEKD